MIFFKYILTILHRFFYLKRVYVIPKNVYINENSIVDIDLNKIIKIDKVAYNILVLFNNKNGIQDIIFHLKKIYNIDKEILERDLYILIKDLTSKNLLEYRFLGNKIFVFFFYLLIGQYICTKRYRVPCHNIITFFLLFYILIKKLFLVWIITLISFGILLNYYIYNPDSKIIFSITCYLFLIFGMVLSFALHEWIHIVISKFQNKSFHGYILEKKLTVSIVKIASESSLASLLLGSLIPSLLGIIFISLYFKMNNPLFLCLGISFVINIINLLPFTKDGKNIIKKMLLN